MSAARSSTATLHISTPEGVVFALPLAGPVTRAIAFFIDFAVVMAIQQAMMVVIVPLSIVVQDFGTAAMLLMQFFLSFGYGAICELLFKGQTLGKRILRIRVMDERGLRLRPSQVIVRNLVRIADMLPGTYAIGGAFCLFSKRCQRLGDFAAGTVVVREVKATPPDVEGVLGGKYNSFRQYPHIEARLRQKVTPDEAQLALAALVRREELEPAAIIKLFALMAERFREKVKFPDEADFGLSDEQYVRNVVDSLYRKG
jgi:uncharacterized RDD family membrane protein YckC